MKKVLLKKKYKKYGTKTHMLTKMIHRYTTHIYKEF